MEKPPRSLTSCEALSSRKVFFPSVFYLDHSPYQRPIQSIDPAQDPGKATQGLPGPQAGRETARAYVHKHQGNVNLRLR